MSSALAPRPDQIAELTRGLDLPLAAIDDIYLQILVEGVSRAFDSIRLSAPTIVAGGDEAEITALLEARLNAMIEEDPVWRQLVDCVVRGKESLSFDGTHLEKRPDLSIYLTARARRFPLIAEAKIIDAAKGEALYCSQGIRRFLNGEYSWGGREAFMIAYVRDGSTLKARLAPYLASTPQAANYTVEMGVKLHYAATVDSGRSRHGRSYLYTHTPPPANDPGPIELWHLWLNASTDEPS